MLRSVVDLAHLFIWLENVLCLLTHYTFNANFVEKYFQSTLKLSYMTSHSPLSSNSTPDLSILTMA